MHLVLIETCQNQNYIFATNKLRENVGASELIARVGTVYTLEAVKNHGGPDLLGHQVRGALRNPNQNPPIENSSYPVEVLVAASGKALLLVKSAEVGRNIINAVTLRALREAPGLEVRGVVGPDFDWNKDSLHQQVHTVHQQFEQVRSRLPGPDSRFLRLPIVAPCGTSGLPAARMAKSSDDFSELDRVEYSETTLAKAAARKGWQTRLEQIWTGHKLNGKLTDATSGLETLGCDWIAVIHADGNSLGEIFLNFDEHVPPSQRDIAADRNRNYAKWLRDFSISLDECTERSFCAAVRKLTARNSVLPIVPLVLGGDDLTVVCDGRQALVFAREFVKEFEKETSNYLASSGFRKKRLTSCAGVAIVKPHFPFFDAYELAEQLLKSAKKLAKHDNDNFVSAIDYHILYDASGPDLRRIRDELTTDNGTTSLVARPYVVTESAGPHHRHIGDLVKRIDAIRAKDSDGRRLLPNSMLHELREALFWGREEAEARLDLVRHRYKPHIDALLVNGKLFWQDGNHHMTGFLDALDTAEFWE